MLHLDKVWEKGNKNARAQMQTQGPALPSLSLSAKRFQQANPCFLFFSGASSSSEHEQLNLFEQVSGLIFLWVFDDVFELLQIFQFYVVLWLQGRWACESRAAH